MKIKKKPKKLNSKISFGKITLISQSCSNIHDSIHIKSSKGSLLSYGCLNLTLTLELKEKDLEQNNLIWENIKNYNSLSFLNNNKNLWHRVKLSSTNSTLQTLLHMNKILDKKIKLKHICFRNINYQSNQSVFKDFVNTVTNNNGLYLESHSVCPCELSIQLRLRFKGRRRLFVLCGEKTSLDDDDDDDGDYDMKEEDNVLLEEGMDYDALPDMGESNVVETFDIEEQKDNEEYNPFINIPKEVNNVNDFSFIYFNYEDYNGNEENTFQGKITIKYLYNYFIYLRKNHRNNKIVLNMGFQVDNIDLEVKDLLAITSIAVFYERNKLFQILNNFRNEEEKIKREQEYFRHYYDKKLKSEEIKEYLNEEDKRSSIFEYLKRRTSENNILERNNLSELSDEFYKPLFRHTRYNKNNKNLYAIKLNKWRYNNITKEKEEEVVKIKDNKYFIPLTKVEMFNYYKTEICEKDLDMKPNEDKMIIVLDELSKLYIVQFNKSYEKPFVLDLDLKLYEQINVHNINKIKHYKETIKANLEEYTILYIGYLLSALMNFTSNENKVSEDAALFIGYYSGQKILKKIVQMEVDENNIPNSDSFYNPNLTKEEIDDLIQQAEKRRKEIKFILDGNNKNIVKLKLYNALLDKYAVSYLNNDKNRHFFKNKGFITEEGKLLYDPVYRESVTVNKNAKKVKDEKDLIDTCRKIKEKNNFKMKENECINNYKNQKEKYNKYMVGFKLKKPEYEMYMKHSQNYFLPVIKKNPNFKSSVCNSPFKKKYSGKAKFRSLKKKLRLNF